MSFLTHQDAGAEDSHHSLLHDGFRVQTEGETEKGSEGKQAFRGSIRDGTVTRHLPVDGNADLKNCQGGKGGMGCLGNWPKLGGQRRTQM